MSDTWPIRVAFYLGLVIGIVCGLLLAWGQS